jgi:hypothetical protein
MTMKTTGHKAYNIIRVLETLRTITDDVSVTRYHARLVPLTVKASGTKPMTYYHDSTITLRLENFNKHVRVNIPLTHDGDVIAQLFVSTSNGDEVFIGTRQHASYNLGNLDKSLSDDEIHDLTVDLLHFMTELEPKPMEKTFKSVKYFPVDYVHGS